MDNNILIQDPEMIKNTLLYQYYPGLGKQQTQKLVDEMYKIPQFADGVLRISGKTTLVIKKRFSDFLKWKNEQYLR